MAQTAMQDRQAWQSWVRSWRDPTPGSSRMQMGSRLCGRAHPVRPSGRGCPPCSLPPWQPGPARTSARPQPELAAAACSTSFLDSSLAVCAISPCAERPALEVLPSKASMCALYRGHVGCRRARRSVCDFVLGGNTCRLIGMISRAWHMASPADGCLNSASFPCRCCSQASNPARGGRQEACNSPFCS